MGTGLDGVAGAQRAERKSRSLTGPWRRGGDYESKSCCLVLKSCPTLVIPVDCSPPGSSVHGILQARVLGWVAIASSRGSS